ncbi:SPOR domain-containing protein [Alcaligenaceae bacterium LF4-65]|uniref:SPOR domain-containing protein n=1 Tax=Zwartia hollandica TaxID=324606 RepID=A0A953N6Y6_9BURK|nr:SPOR domain-containing protein [Zwartia hollandica]MBZ1349224.1 SPOR domain-containing protein [Zwartia hollandica]
MGLFSRKDSASARKPAVKPRPSVTSEAQAAEMRVRARRRLAGAVALVLTAVIVLPMLLDSEPAPVATNIPIRIPDRQAAPFGPNAPEPPAAVEPTAVAQATPGAAPAPGATAAVSDDPKPELKVDPKRTDPPTRTEPPKAASPALSARSADGERALALLEGRPVRPAGASPTPAQTAAPRPPPAAGNFVVQAMSLDSADDAQRQRGKLLASGVSNAFVDGPVNVNGNPKYRVRIGPFPSREAAQAAQTRLRTLGYSGAFIASQ